MVCIGKKAFFESIEYISDFSLQGAESVIRSIDKGLQKAVLNPRFYPPDKWKVNNPASNYRAFEIKRFRIVYKIIPSKLKIRVMFFRHSRQEPKKY